MLTHPWNTGFAWERTSGSPRRLRQDEVDRFHDDGWFVVEDLVDERPLALTDAQVANGCPWVVPGGADVLEGDAPIGPPTGRVRQVDAGRQYEILRGGELVS